MSETLVSRNQKILTGVFFVVWLVAVATWKYFTRLADSHTWVTGVYWAAFAATIPFGLYWWLKVRQADIVRRRAVGTFIGVMWWLHLVDLNGAFAGEPVNAAPIEEILMTVVQPDQQTMIHLSG